MGRERSWKGSLVSDTFLQERHLTRLSRVPSNTSLTMLVVRGGRGGCRGAGREESVNAIGVDHCHMFEGYDVAGCVYEQMHLTAKNSSLLYSTQPNTAAALNEVYTAHSAHTPHTDIVVHTLAD